MAKRKTPPSLEGSPGSRSSADSQADSQQGLLSSIRVFRMDKRHSETL
jgi:hypothetical protein